MPKPTEACKQCVSYIRQYIKVIKKQVSEGNKIRMLEGLGNYLIE